MVINKPTALVDIELLYYEDTVIHRFSVKQIPNVNSYVVETVNSVVIIDTQFNEDNAWLLRKYVEQFNKPIKAVIITHAHFDHYKGLPVFDDVPSYTTAEVLQDFNNLPSRCQYCPSDVLDNNLYIDDLQYQVINYQNNHCTNHLVLLIPKLSTAIVGDLCQHKGHLLVYDFDGYIQTLTNLYNYQNDYHMLLTGHSKVATFFTVKENLNYIKKCKQLAIQANDNIEYDNLVRQAFPERSKIILSLAYLLRDDWLEVYK